jgi:hypothetical protein
MQQAALSLWEKQLARPSGLPPITVAYAANILSKCLILLDGGEGGIRTHSARFASAFLFAPRSVEDSSEVPDTSGAHYVVASTSPRAIGAAGASATTRTPSIARPNPPTPIR